MQKNKRLIFIFVNHMIRKGHSEIMENYYRMLGTIYQIFTTEF